MSFLRRLAFLSVLLLLCSRFVHAVSAELVTFDFNGTAQATVDSTFFPSLEFMIQVSIDDTAQDQFPRQNGRGGFVGATTTVTIPDAGIFNDEAVNLTGILQEGVGNSSNFRLVDANNLFGAAGVGLRFNTPIFTDPDSINPLLDPLLVVQFGEGGLPWQLLLGPDVTFNSVRDVTVSNGIVSSANVPEPTSFTLFGIGLLAVGFKRRR